MKTTAYGSLNPTADRFMTVAYTPQQGPTKLVYLKRADLSQESQLIYDNFEALFTGHASVEIANTPAGIDIDFTSNIQLLPTPALSLDYNTMSIQDQSAVSLFINLVSITPEA